ncbi:MAG: hypothetical protein SF097_08710 [Acidobacteriota bacterium]|nr:hypothetical protein [Acidobacteriota bacterium]
MVKVLRDVEISPPTFETFEEALGYAERFQQPQAFVTRFVASLNGRLRFSAPIKFDSFLSASGSAVISPGREAIKIGEAALVRDSELFKTLVHEEMHLRLIRKAREGSQRALNFVTDPQIATEEDYVERIAVRYLRMYESAFEKFNH